VGVAHLAFLRIAEVTERISEYTTWVAGTARLYVSGGRLIVVNRSGQYELLKRLIRLPVYKLASQKS